MEDDVCVQQEGQHDARCERLTAITRQKQQRFAGITLMVVGNDEDLTRSNINKSLLVHQVLYNYIIKITKNQNLCELIKLSMNLSTMKTLQQTNGNIQILVSTSFFMKKWPSVNTKPKLIKGNNIKAFANNHKFIKYI